MDLGFFNDLFPPPQDESFLVIFIPAGQFCKILKDDYADFLNKLRRRGFHPKIYCQAEVVNLAEEVFIGETLNELKIGLSKAFDVYTAFMNLNVESEGKISGLSVFFWPISDIISFFEDYFKESTILLKKISSGGFYLSYLIWWPEVEIKIIQPSDLVE